MKGSIRSAADWYMILGFLVVAGISIFYVYSYLQAKSYNYIKQHSNEINLLGEIKNIEKDSEDNFLYGETVNAYIFSVKKLKGLCFPNKEKNKSKDEEFYLNYPEIMKLNMLAPIGLKEMSKNTEVINYHTGEYIKMNCNDFSNNNQALYYKEKPVYFLIKKL